MKPLKLVVIDWVDSCTSDGWIKTDDVDLTVAVCRSAGFLLKKTKYEAVLVQNVAHDGGTLDMIMRIPLGCIKRIRTIPGVTT